MHDQLATGRKLRVLTVVDRFSPALDARFSYCGEDVVATLDRVCGDMSYPKAIRVDQGSEFVSRDLDLWTYRHGVTLDFSRPGKPTDNAFIGAFNGRYRAECLNTHWFLTLADAQEKLRLGEDTTTRTDHTARLGTRPQQRCEIPPTSPASRRDEARKFYLRVVQGWVSEHPDPAQGRNAHQGGSLFSENPQSPSVPAAQPLPPCVGSSRHRLWPATSGRGSLSSVIGYSFGSG